jgi:hypothetical protein
MNTEQKRIALFLFGCMGTRLGFAWLAYVASPRLLTALGYLALLPAIGFFAIYFLGLRKTGPEVFGDRIWWNHLRPIHGTLYAAFAYAAITGQSYAWKILLADAVIGLMAFLNHHFG